MITNPLLEIREVSQTYDRKRLTIKEISLVLHRGEIGCLLGPSGGGKTTLLRVIAGFEQVVSGTVAIEGRRVSSPGYTLAPENRLVGMVFQDYALFPHLTVFQNIAFGLRAIKATKRRALVQELLETTGLARAEAKYPHELSGGQQQRVALARALAPHPHLLLLDEPFSNLDVTMRERLSSEVREMLKQRETTTLMVTHNQSEAFALADTIGIVMDGKVQQWDTADTIYRRPANPVVAGFVGEGSFLPGTVLDDRRVRCPLGILGGDFISGYPSGCDVDVFIRPEDVVCNERNGVRARVTGKIFRGSHVLYTLRLDTGHGVCCLIPSRIQHEIGQYISIKAEVKDILLFERNERSSSYLSMRGEQIL
jgi:iron(III) transport system ATP-binding protein